MLDIDPKNLTKFFKNYSNYKKYVAKCFFFFFYKIYLFVSVEKPSAPGRPQVTLMGPNSAMVTWPVPRHDGGSPISNYIVEAKSNTSYNWTVCNIGFKVTMTTENVMIL